MKTFSVFIAAMFLITAYSFAQAGNNYRDRNHKLNSNHSAHIKNTAYTVPAKTDISSDVYTYMARNIKLNQGKVATALVMEMPAKDFHYLSLNHKLKGNASANDSLRDETAVTHK